MDLSNLNRIFNKKLGNHLKKKIAVRLAANCQIWENAWP